MPTWASNAEYLVVNQDTNIMAQSKTNQEKCRPKSLLLASFTLMLTCKPSGRKSTCQKSNCDDIVSFGKHVVLIGDEIHSTQHIEAT
jgi:hypothetical protein